MAMGRRKTQQSHLFLPTARGGGHRFYEALDKLLLEADFDAKVESLCAPHYAASNKPGRPSVAPGLYFRMMLVGFFEGIASERGIAWRCADSISLRDFLGLAPHVPVPDASTVSRTRRRLPVDVFDEVFRLVLGIVDAKGLLSGRVRGVDSTYLKADASMRSIVRKDSGEDYRSYIKRVAAEAEAEAAVASASGHGDRVDHDDDESGGSSSPPDSVGAVDTAADASAVDASPVTNPPEVVDDAGDDSASNQGTTSTTEETAATPARRVTTEEAVRHDRRRKKTTSNKDWRSPTDPDARIVRMKDGTTRLGYKPEHVVDMETGAILSVVVHGGDQHDASTIRSTLAVAEQNIASIRPNQESNDVVGERWHKEPVAAVVADKGYHKVATLSELKDDGYRTYIPEKKQRGRRKFTDKGGAQAAAVFHQNRARTRRAKGKALQRRRGELVERPNQHLYDRTGLRRLTLTRRKEIQKRICLEAASFNLGRVLRKIVGAGAPKWLAAAFAAALAALWAAVASLVAAALGVGDTHQRRSWERPGSLWRGPNSEIGLSTSAC
jgi:IS5 family transposase